jgi:hypothetical protein
MNTHTGAIAISGALCAWQAFLAPRGAAAGFVPEMRTDSLVRTWQGRAVGECVFRDAEIPRPYFTRLHAPDGTQLTRNHPPVKGVDASTRPVWAHARDYGFLASNPTGSPPDGKDVPSIPFTVPAGESLRLRFGLLLQAGADPLDHTKVVERISKQMSHQQTP